MASAALGKRLDEIEKQQALQSKAYDERVKALERQHEGDMKRKDKAISDLSEMNAAMLRVIRRDHPGWAPGDLEVTSGTTGG